MALGRTGNLIQKVGIGWACILRAGLGAHCIDRKQVYNYIDEIAKK